MPSEFNEIFEHRWDFQVRSGEGGAPLVSPLYVLAQGSNVALIDLRSPAEATAVLGFIPGSVFMSAASVTSGLPDDQPVILVSRTGKAAAQIALKLDQAGRPHVAALAGGLVAWRNLGLKTSRDPAGVRTDPYTVDFNQHDSVSLATVEQHIGDPRNVRWIKAASMASYGYFSCIDGRDERGVVGTLGGDAGEFLLTLAALEQVTGRSLSETDVFSTLAAHVEAFGHFYMHTDADAFGRLADSLRTDTRLAPSMGALTDMEGQVDSLRYPEPQLRDALLEHLVEPTHIGCGHLRLMLENGDEYGIRGDLVADFLRAFYRLWWDGLPELEPTILPGDHEEAAVLNIRLAEEVWGLTPIPLVSPAFGGRQMFVNHPDVASYLRETFMRFHVEGLGGLSVPPDRAADLAEATKKLGHRQLHATLGHLARGLPIYDVVFARDRSFTVREV